MRPRDDLYVEKNSLLMPRIIPPLFVRPIYWMGTRAYISHIYTWKLILLNLIFVCIFNIYLFIYLPLTYGLFNDAVSNSVYILRKMIG
jgi:hypothetical protein